ncbi:GNAT family N-acetyltransferase [Flavobacterium suzhouense]|uniref:GNAT family N-acetyltransferase n=1 Tax=Flavobacterium suzhouense TaxID=1529638 RepID=A0ABW5NPX4_9FLAO
MPVIAKFIVANEENAYKVSEMANAYYTTSKQKDTAKENTVSAFLNKANSFTTEWLMTFDVTGEDEDRVEEPLALLVLISANLPKEADGGKPLYIERTIPSGNDEGNQKLLNRAFEIAAQRKHDVVWAEVKPADTALANFYKDLGFRESGKRDEALLFKKAL